MEEGAAKGEGAVRLGLEKGVGASISDSEGTKS